MINWVSENIYLLLMVIGCIGFVLLLCNQWYLNAENKGVNSGIVKLENSIDQLSRIVSIRPEVRQEFISWDYPKELINNPKDYELEFRSWSGICLDEIERMKSDGWDVCSTKIIMTHNHRGESLALSIGLFTREIKVLSSGSLLEPKQSYLM